MIATARDVEGTLRLVLRMLHDGQRGSRTLGERLHSKVHRRFFLAESLRRAKFRGQLEEALRLEGISDPRTGGTFVGWVHRIGMRAVGALGIRDNALLQIAERGEAQAIRTYQEAIDRRLPSHLHRLLLDQAPSMRRAHEYVKAAHLGMVPVHYSGKRKASRQF